MSPRVRKVLKLVDELELDAAERRAVRVELDAREECIVDLDGADDEQRAFLLELKRRVDTILRGEAKTLTMAEANAFVREELRKRRAARAAGSPRSRTRRVG